MATPVTPDLSLPSKSPAENKSFYNENHDGDKFAVYTLVDLGSDGIDGLVKTLEDGNTDLEDTQSLPSKYDFRGKSLKDVYDYHLQLGREERLNPTLFIVAQYENYKANGVLLVNLNTDLELSIDTCRISSAEALLAAVNIEIANNDWEDWKEEEMPLPGAPSPDPSD
ncbi:hypothetical protein MMC10_005032 [Thelotrema lepadinum]|nr:hypothetical protein [Thelotrema lepadinum]